MELLHLQSFVAVATAGSFTEAARSTYTSQPTLSRHVAAVERWLGAVVFRRSAAGADLTPAGAALLAQARRLDAELLALRRAVGEQP